jgi:hypothetical protein
MHGSWTSWSCFLKIKPLTADRTSAAADEKVSPLIYSSEMPEDVAAGPREVLTLDEGVISTLL